MTAALDGRATRGHISISVDERLLAEQQSEGWVFTDEWSECFSLLADGEDEHGALSDVMVVEEDERQTSHE